MKHLLVMISFWVAVNCYAQTTKVELIYDEDVMEIPEMVEEEALSPGNPDSVIYQIVEEMPEYPGGQEQLLTYLSSVEYPQEALDNKWEGRAIIGFVVEKDGTVGEVQVKKSSGHELLDEAATDLVKSMEQWKPGMQRGKPVRVAYDVPLNFKL